MPLTLLVKVFLIHSGNVMINAHTCLDLPSSNKRSHRLCPWLCLASWFHIYTGLLAGGMLALRQGAQYLCGCSETLSDSRFLAANWNG